ncbi:MAG: TonB-dependent receptor, partial [Pseudomonadota bacterium]
GTPASNTGVEGRVGVGFNFIGERPLPYGQFSPSVSLLDASAALAWRAFELGVEATNVLGRTYAANEYSFVSNWGRQDIPSLIPARHISAGPPRSLLGTLTVRF